jgi:hypothetical protein
MYLSEIDDALARARAAAGIDKFELVGMDACLMGHLEVMNALAEHANFAVLSQEPSRRWAGPTPASSTRSSKTPASMAGNSAS